MTFDTLESSRHSNRRISESQTDPTSPATVTAANNLCRCLLGAGQSAVIILMIDSMGRGWCFTFITLVIFATTPILLILMRWGPKWREERAQKMETAKKARDEQRRERELRSKEGV